MTVRAFRLLLIASVATGLLGGTIDLLVPSLLSEYFRHAQDTQDSALSTSRLLFVATLGGGLLVMLVACIHGLYQLRSWAPRLALLSTLLALAIPPVAGAFAQSGYAISLSYVASYLWGVVLFLALAPPFNAHFRRAPDDQDPGAAGKQA